MILEAEIKEIEKVFLRCSYHAGGGLHFAVENAKSVKTALVWPLSPG